MSGRANRSAGSPIIGVVTIELHFPDSQSLKAKRMVVRSIKDRLRRRFNVAVAETGYLDLWQRSEITAVSVSGTRSVLESQLEAIHRELEERFGSELLRTSNELIE